MPKRSLHPGNGDTKKIEQLNLALEQMMARNDGQVGKMGPELEPLVRIAAELRNLPNAMFKARLKSELEGRKRMSTVAEPVAGVRTTASPRLAFRDAAKAIATGSADERRTVLEVWLKTAGTQSTTRRDIGNTTSGGKTAE